MMNLTTDGWIPVANAKGEKTNLSLRQVFAEGHHWQDFAVRPHERVALMRLLICIAQAALEGPMTTLDGCEVDLPAKADAYLIKWQDSFELFHPTKPFLQFAGLEKSPKAAKKVAGKKATITENEDDEDATPASKLDFALASGERSTLFDHQAASAEIRIFAPAELALMLITFQCFSPGGTIGSANWNGEETPGTFTGKAIGSSSNAPCVPSSMMHAFIRQDSLLAMIVANLLTFDTVNSLYRHDSWGLPMWEWMPESLSDADAIKNATETYLGRLMPLSRAVLLRSDGKGLLLANGLDYPTHPNFAPEPSASLVKKRDDTGYALVGAGSRALWRELPALVVERRFGEAGGPLTLSSIRDEHAFDLWVGALITNPTRPQDILDTVEGVYSIPSKMRHEAGRMAYKAEVEYADQKVRYALSDATKRYRQLLELKPQGYPEQTVAIRHYWNAVEQLLWRLNASISAEDGSEDQVEKRNAWRSALWKAARDAYHASCAFETPRQKRAFSLGLRSLQYIQRKKDEPTTPVTQAA